MLLDGGIITVSIIQALDLLMSCKNKIDMTEDILESISTLHESSNETDLKKACIDLINEAEKNEKKLKGRVLSVWSKYSNRDKLSN